jgi:hypothetical protein
MRVYFFDDREAKQESFLKALSLTNRLAQKASGIEGQFSDGFEGAGTKILKQPGALLRAATSGSDAVCLIDLDFPEHFQVTAQIWESIPATRHAEVERLFLQLKEAPGYDKNFSLGVTLLCVCFVWKTPAIIVSTRGFAGLIASIVALGALGNIVWPDDKGLSEDDPRIRQVAEILLGFIEPLTAIEAKTGTWFQYYDWQPGALPHDYQVVGSTPERHMEVVRQVFPWFPRSWWGVGASEETAAENESRIVDLHETLKTLCGHYASWMAASSGRPLSIGGAYLLLLLAMKQQFPNWPTKARESDIFVPAMSLFPLQRWFLPPQEHDDAKRTVTALFSLFRMIIPVKDTLPAECAIEKISLLSDQSGFRVRLGWTESQRKAMGEALSSHIKNNEDMVRTPSGKVIGALLRFNAASQVSKGGFGSPGTVFLSANGDLTVASVLTGTL